MPDNKTYPLKAIKWYKDLSTTKERVESKAFLVEGSRAIEQIIKNNPLKVVEILSSDEPSPLYQKYPQRQLTDQQLLSISSTKAPQGTIAVVRLPPDSYSDCLPENTGSKILLLEDVQDPGNVGTLIRSAVAFGYSGIILTDKSADPFSPKCIQSSAGTVLSLWIRRTRYYDDLVIELQKSGYILVSADLNGKENPSVLQNSNKLVLALGNEASGLSGFILKTSDYRLRIPIVNQKAESLNVAACGAICMYLSSLGC